MVGCRQEGVTARPYSSRAPPRLRCSFCDLSTETNIRDSFCCYLIEMQNTWSAQLHAIKQEKSGLFEQSQILRTAILAQPRK